MTELHLFSVAECEPYDVTVEESRIPLFSRDCLRFVKDTAEGKALRTANAITSIEQISWALALN